MSEPAAPAPAAKSKAAKIWKRTYVGLSIAGGLLLVLWGASAMNSPLPVLAVTLGVLAVCIVEVDRMGALRGRKLGWMLAPAAVAVGLLLAMLLYVDPGEEPRTAAELAHGSLYATAWTATVVLLASFAFIRLRSWLVRVAAVACVFPCLMGIDGPPWLDFVGPVLFFFLVARTLLIGGQELRVETLAVVGLGVALVVSMPGLAVAWRAFGHLGLVALLAICKLGDTAGYYVGSTLGRHKPFKSISPNKTAEGCAGSLVASALAGAAAVAVGWLPSEPYGYVGGLIAGALVNIAAQASDLLESWVKRKAGVKDSGTWFSSSGGMLDLVDSFFLATPVALLAWPVLFAFPPIFLLAQPLD